MNTQEKQDKRQAPRRSHWVRRTHRVLGVSSALFLVLISASGLILNHADALGMSRQAAAPWLLRVYGIELPPVDSAFAAADALFATCVETLYANGEMIAKSVRPLIGAVAIGGGIVVATGNEFFVMSADAVLIERSAPDQVGPVTQLGTDGQRIIVAIQDRYFEFDPQRMSLSTPTSITTGSISWSRPTTLSDQQDKQIATAALGQAINLERVLLDFHSGRILPAVGRYIADITALCLLYMCFSGIVLWTRRR